MRLDIFLLLSFGMVSVAAAQSGVASHDDLLLGFHFNQYPRSGPANELGTELNFEEFTQLLNEDMPYLSYADFWVGWSDMQRYKGDEKGLASLDRAVVHALVLDLKVKIVLIHSTWWAHDLDWSQRQNLAIGPNHLEDWAHWCAVMSSHFRGRVAQWDLQGEANGKDYWPFATAESVLGHVQESYRVGCRAIRQAAPEALIGISCATPGTEGIDIYDQRISRPELDRWYHDNLSGCKGLFDSVPINYFSDVTWADPYGGGFAFYKSIRRMLDDLGLPQVELGSGESSINWADSSYDFQKYGLSIPVQARRLNETLGATFNDGMNKWIFHGIPQAPGFGWVWRWGFRKYEDFWGLWPEANKTPGTRIVCRYDNPDGRKVDYGPAFARPADPYLPSWEIWKFWAQAMPRHSGARRLHLRASGGDGILWRLGAFLPKSNEAVALVYNEHSAPLRLALDVTPAGWADGTALVVAGRNESISFETGEHRVLWRDDGLRAEVVQGAVALTSPPLSGWTSLRFKPAHPEFTAELGGTVFPRQAQAGGRVRGQVLLRNTGSGTWPKGARVTLNLWPQGESRSTAKVEVHPLAAPVKPSELACFEVVLPEVEQPQLKTWTLRPGYVARGSSSLRPFGPALEVSCEIVDGERPRKFIACRELGHIRLSWFRPEHVELFKAYEIYRSQGLGQPKRLVQKVSVTDYVDSNVSPDQVYEYYVVAVAPDGRRSRASNLDSARALAAPRLWDAEVTAHNIPARVHRGEPATVSVTLRNSGSKPWDLRPESGLRVYLQTAQLWDERNEGRLPQVGLGEPRVIEPGQTVTVSFPYVGRAVGEFENHWITRLEAKGGSGAWFGTPLRVQTTVTSQ
jgi:hypothetical protein